MSPEFVLAIDAGTSGARSMVVDLGGRLASLSYRGWCYQSPAELAPLGKELDPQQFWDIICESIGEAVAKAAIDPRDIIAVSATSQREGLVFLDEEGQELYAGPNLDLRALAEGMCIDSQFGAEVYSITGHRPSFLFAPAKLKWFQSHQPQIYERIATVLTISDWIIYKLSGRRVSEACGASELGLLDIHERTWSSSLQDILELPRGIYPELVPAGSPVGGVTPRAAAETGLTQGTAVAMGAPDSECGLLALGVAENREVGIVAGWSAPVQMVSDGPIIDPEAKVWASCHLLPGKWILESSAGEAGNAYRWLREVAFSEDGSSEEAAYELMDRLAQQSAPGAEGVLAFIGPLVMDVRHLALKWGGFLFPVPLSFTDIHKGHLVRAALENLCFAIKANCEQLEAISGFRVTQARIGGGLARSRCLLQILPAVLQRPVCFPETTEVCGLGAAMCAAAGSGASSLEQAIEAMKPGLSVIEPEPTVALEYEECYQRWATAAAQLERLSEELQ